MKTLHEKAQAYFDGLKTVFIDVIGVEKSSQLQQLKVLELFTPNAFMAGYETHQHETRWRSVEEELPETNNFGNGISAEVLCYVPDVHKVLSYSKNKFYPNGAWFNLSEELQQYPTHWKPIE